MTLNAVYLGEILMSNCSTMAALRPYQFLQLPTLCLNLPNRPRKTKVVKNDESAINEMFHKSVFVLSRDGETGALHSR